MRNQQKVQQAILDRLQTRSGLDLNSLDITTTHVSFEQDMAYATVAFHPKGNSGVDSGMTMKYTLEARGGRWIVVGVGDSKGSPLTGQPAQNGGSLPPGHPPITNPQAEGQRQ